MTRAGSASSRAEQDGGVACGELDEEPAPATRTPGVGDERMRTVQRRFTGRSLADVELVETTSGRP